MSLKSYNTCAKAIWFKGQYSIKIKHFIFPYKKSDDSMLI